MLSVHSYLGTWAAKIDAYIALTEFARNKFIAGGLPAEKIHVKPNFTDLEPAERDATEDYALFLGRLVPEKGISTLLDAWRLYRGSLTLKIAGEGPLSAELERKTSQSNLQNVDFLGQITRSAALSLMKKARFVIVPSLWYEGFPMVIVESFACGVPVIASELGAMQEVIDHDRTGLHFRPGDARELANRIAWAEAHPARMEIMGKRARKRFESHYGPETNYRALMQIYNSVAR
jgi:glycosyltransferase involved in cell wall biosynthesis